MATETHRPRFPGHSCATRTNAHMQLPMSRPNFTMAVVKHEASQCLSSCRLQTLARQVDLRRRRHPPLSSRTNHRLVNFIVDIWSFLLEHIVIRHHCRQRQFIRRKGNKKTIPDQTSCREVTEMVLLHNLYRILASIAILFIRSNALGLPYCLVSHHHIPRSLQPADIRCRIIASTPQPGLATFTPFPASSPVWTTSALFR